MFYLPRICEHCLNPSCVASCPSGAMYKREEDGIVLVDQDRCRGWRFCVSGCPYKKVYFNHRTGKAEKCTLCFPRIEAGQPTICSETCVGRLRYLGLFLYDADKVLAAAATPDPQDLYQAQLSVFLDPDDPAVQAEAARQGIPADWIDAARRSPVYALAVRHKVALPLHPEYRTLPMVWYIPPLSPVADVVHAEGYDPDRPRPGVRRHRRAADPGGVPGEPVHRRRRRHDPRVLRKLAAVRAVHAGRPARPGRGSGPARLGRRDRGRPRGPVPAARDRQVRRPLRDPARARRGRRAADVPARAAVLQPRHRRRPGHGRSRPAGSELPGHQNTPGTAAAAGHPAEPPGAGQPSAARRPRPLQPARLGRAGQRTAPVPGAGPAREAS